MHRPILGGQQQAQPMPFAAPTWYQPPTVTPSINSTYPLASSGMGPPSDLSMSSRLTSVANQISNSRPFSPAPNAQFSDMLPALQEKSLDELNQLLMDKKAYNLFLHSLEPVRHLDSLRGELMKGHADLARNNLAKDSQIAELRNQCTIIRTTELAAARERFEEVQKQEKEITATCSSSALLDRLQVVCGSSYKIMIVMKFSELQFKEAATKVDDESEVLHEKLLSGDIDLTEFIQKYKKQRILYHRRMLIHLAAKTSLGTPGPVPLSSASCYCSMWLGGMPTYMNSTY
ncbi:vacuolar protein-sorting-associated protein 37 homolog 2 isoform X2 [Cryptomeria japonica]|uniref:vacuolar protein-sorting-associated protein 37 homolog 2 isoform X2 n=1 Tax=Cryptomeria japonica TaxID=3369 RepID=UPI0025ACE357|nr:vacuolar protein-sorting-associated protein 37 homolog 2 isoform X2 [Cryptomeria japonica]